MRFGTAIERLVDNYRTAKGKVWIRDEVAWALYQTWKEADRKTEQTEPQKIGYCNECKWFRDKQVCGRCRSKNMYAPKDEPKTETSTNFEKIQLTEVPQREECPFDDTIPCEWVNCPNSTDCPYKPQTERSSE